MNVLPVTFINELIPYSTLEREEKSPDSSIKYFSICSIKLLERNRTRISGSHNDQNIDEFNK